jgi:F-type H+-transporting ATPase subunit delta
MKRNAIFKRLANDFLKVVPDIEAQEEVLKEAERVPECKPFIQAVRRLQEDRGVCKVLTVMSAIPLTAHERDALKKKLTDLWHVSIYLKEVIDPRVIGGIRLSAEDWEYDATISGRLHRLEHTFIS